MTGTDLSQLNGREALVNACLDWNAQRLRVLALVRARREFKCEEASDPDYSAGDGGIPPCYIAAASEMCGPCQQRERVTKTIRYAKHVRGELLGRMERIASRLEAGQRIRPLKRPAALTALKEQETRNG